MKVIVFDTETTGLVQPLSLPLDKQPEIIELFAIKYDLKKDKKLGEVHYLFEPQKSISDVITKITGLSDKDVEGKPRFGHHAKAISNYLQKADAVIAHNFKFDQSMIEFEMKRVGLAVKWPRRICTVEQTMHIKHRRMKLNELHEYLFGESFSGAHRARADVEALLKCVKKLYKDGAL